MKNEKKKKKKKRENEREREILRLRLRMGTTKTRKLNVGRKEQSAEMKLFSTSSREPTDNREQR